MRNQRKIHDRLGIYIGKLRTHEGITQERLAQGLCNDAHLARIELGEREADKLLIDAMLQRLGKSADMFDRFLDGKEKRSYDERTQILSELKKRNIEKTDNLLRLYQEKEKGCLQTQFIEIVKLNLLYLEGIDKQQLCDKVLAVLQMTQPEYGMVPLRNLLLSRNEGYLLLTYLELREKQVGAEALSASYQELMNYLEQPRYEKAERCYLYPYVVYHVANQKFMEGNLSEARVLCEKVLEELREEKLLCGFQKIFLLRQKIMEVCGECGSESRNLAGYLIKIQEKYKGQKESLWLPYAECNSVHSLNRALAERRKILKISQEMMADGICNTSTISRIENGNGAVQKRIRRDLLQKVNLSGERYDYEIITEDYEDYLLRSRLGRYINSKNWLQALELLEYLRQRTPDTQTNLQYLKMAECCIREQLPEKHPDKISLDKRISCLKSALSLTLPHLVSEWKELSKLPAATLSINEIVILKQLASCYRRQDRQEVSLQILLYIKRCMESEMSKQAIDVDTYMLCMSTLVSILGDCGRYRESDILAKNTLMLLFESQKSQRMVDFLYCIAWNREQQVNEKSGQCAELLKQAYAAALIVNDKAGQQHIREHYKQVYGVELLF